MNSQKCKWSKKFVSTVGLVVSEPDFWVVGSIPASGQNVYVVNICAWFDFGCFVCIYLQKKDLS